MKKAVIFLCLATITTYINAANQLVPHAPPGQLIQAQQNPGPMIVMSPQQFQQLIHYLRSPEQPLQIPPIINTIYNNPNNTTTTTNNTTSTLPPPPPPPPNISFFDKGSEFLWKNQYYFAGVAAISLYSFIEYYVWIAQDLLSNKQSWGNWKSNMKLSELYTMPPDRLFDELAFEIALRYVSPDNLFDTAHLLRSFFDALDYEQKTLKRFLRIHWWLGLGWVNWFFLTTDSQAKRAKRQLKRLRFIKSVVMSRIAQHTYLGLTPQNSEQNSTVFHKTLDGFSF